MRTIKEKEVELTEYVDYDDARRQLGRFLDAVYNVKRIHSALGHLTPQEFEQQQHARAACDRRAWQKSAGASDCDARAHP
jgi:hypothetical protein